MALIQLTSANSPYILKAEDFSELLNIPYCLLIASGGGSITVNLPTINSLNKFGKVLVVCADGITTVTINSNAADAITESGSIALSKTVTGNKNFIELEAATYVSGNVWLGSTNGGSGGGGNIVVPITFSNLQILVNTNNLTQGGYYLITDFQMATYIQFSGGGLGSEDIHVGAVEPMLVQAATSNSFATNIISTVYPTDIITWNYNFADREWDAVLGQSTGVITSREDTLWQIKRDFDFRNIVFRRWETINGSGVYDSVFSTPFAYQDYPPFAPNNCFKCYIGSPLYVSGGFGIPYWLDNTIGKQGASLMNIEIAYANNIEGFFDTNGDMKILVNNNISTQDPNISPDFVFNSIDLAVNNYVDLIDSNAGFVIQDNSRQTSSGSLKITSNNCKGITGNVFDGEINRNGVIDVSDNTSVMPNCLISENAGVEINNNVDFTEISGNNVGYIKDNAGGSTAIFEIKDNVGFQIFSNSNGFPTSGGGIYNNNIGQISNCSLGANSIRYCVGSQLEINIASSDGDFDRNILGIISQVQFAGIGGGAIGITNNTFQANIYGGVITPTATLASNQATQTVFDTLKGNCELTITNAVIATTPI